MYLDQQLHTYLDDLASGQPTPGGGSTAAMCGAMASALVSMVAHLTLNKADYADVHPQVTDILQNAEKLRADFQRLIQADIEAYGGLSASYKLPRTNDEEKATRARSIQEALVNAALVPLQMAENAAEVGKCCMHLAEIGNKTVLSDIATASTLATSAGSGASWMVRVNVRSMRDAARAEEIGQRLDRALDTLEKTTEQAIHWVGDRS
jgi:formiminotetrahydrofolate cyclodeaminase